MGKVQKLLMRKIIDRRCGEKKRIAYLTKGAEVLLTDAKTDKAHPYIKVADIKDLALGGWAGQSLGVAPFCHRRWLVVLLKEVWLQSILTYVSWTWDSLWASGGAMSDMDKEMANTY
jgi:hypothetical protein